MMMILFLILNIAVGIPYILIISENNFLEVFSFSVS